MNGRWYYIKNWWYYYKWYVVCGIILLAVAVRLIGGAFGFWEKEPDYQIAYVGETELPEETVEVIEKAFAAVSDDFNGDGEVLVRVNQYTAGSLESGSTFGADVPLIGDINDCDSYFFLMDNPDYFQREYHLLADADGSCPVETDYSTEDKVISWTDCTAFSDLEPGTYTDTLLGVEITGDNQDILSGLFLGRRCFYNDKTVPYLDQCDALWDFLTGSVSAS